MDNFLKKKAFKITPQQGSSSAGGSGHGHHNDSAMKYFSAVETVKYYERTEHADESESDILLSMDDDVPLTDLGMSPSHSPLPAGATIANGRHNHHNRGGGRGATGAGGDASSSGVLSVGLRGYGGGRDNAGMSRSDSTSSEYRLLSAEIT